ncbi:hypothetical protein EAF04_005950 [Stromatinia cepivora]|nr:hypothetical protein EAF04_005950 [Stromatinia cepivora]
MLILNTKQDDVEVPIKRYPDDTYHDEYIKVEDKEDHSDKKRERYIVAEPGTTYYIEFGLKKGYDFGEYSLIKARLFFPGRDQAISRFKFGAKPENRPKLKTDLIEKIQYADVEVDGQKMLGARFAFRNIEIDETLSNETDIMGIHPDNLATFTIKLYLWKRRTITLSDDDYKNALSDWEKKCSKARSTSGKHNKLNLKPEVEINRPNARNLWDAKKVDLDSYKKRGISSAIGFVGGHDTSESSSGGKMRGIS